MSKTQSSVLLDCSCSQRRQAAVAFSFSNAQTLGPKTYASVLNKSTSNITVTLFFLLSMRGPLTLHRPSQWLNSAAVVFEHSYHGTFGHWDDAGNSELPFGKMLLMPLDNKKQCDWD